MSANELLKRPVQVVHAVRILYLVVGIGIIRASMTVMRHADVRSPYFLISTKFLLSVAALFVIYQLGKGRNWARWSLVVILFASIPLTILPAFGSISHNLTFTLTVFLQVALYIVALVLLFQRVSSNWFDRGKVSKGQ